MATATELLINNEDVWFEVDLLSRRIVIPNTITNLGTKNDKNVMHVRFKLPRFYHDVDFSDFEIGIDYTNAKGEEDRYEPEDVTVDDNVITFTWVVGRHAALHDGNVTFGLCAKRLNPDNPDDPENEFHTTPVSLPILDSMETCEEVIVEHIDLLEQWRQQLFERVVTDEQIESAVNKYLEENPIDSGAGVYVGSGEMPDNCNVQIDPSGNAIDEVLLCTEQTLTPEQQTQARKNISAVGKNVIDGMTIEGFERTGNYESVKDLAEKTEGEYCYSQTAHSGVPINSVAIANWNWYRLPVKSGEKYYISAPAVSAVRAYHLADTSDKQIVTEPGVTPAKIEQFTYEITIPENGGFLYVNEFGSFPCQIKRLNTDIPHFKPVEEKQNTFDHLYGKKLACVGDSITEATNPDGGYFTNYAEIAATRHGMSVYKDGKGGSTMTDVRGVTVPAVPPVADKSFCISRYLDVPSDFDILTIWFGWNDSYYAKNSIGTIDSTEDTTFYGAYKKVIEYFIMTYPTKKIGLIVPYGGESVEPCRAAVRALSEMYGVPCLDLADGKQCSLLWGTANDSQLARRAALTYDGTHPNQDGHEYLSTMYEEFIKRL